MSETTTLKAPTFFTPKRIARMAIFIALSAVGSFIKIPSPTGTVAMDSCPGYFSVLAWGYLEGAIVISLGHLFTAATVGFPLGWLHIVVAIGMIIWAAMLKFFTDKIHIVAGVIAGTIGNGVLGAAMMVPFFGWGFFYALLPFLTVASLIDISIAAAAYLIVKKSGYI
ncbi:MAG: ECF transporter S component [Candidatus Asgardarchaeia archaeon]